MSIIAGICFLLIIGLTLGITIWAGRKATSRSELYAAGGQISAFENGLAITGDFVSSAAIFGSVALFYMAGVGMVTFFVAPLVGLCLLRIFIAGPLRKLGHYTLGDVLVTKLGGRSICIFSGICTLVLSEMYIVAQLVASGTLFALLLGIPYFASVVAVGALVSIYVGFGGMLATTWVQITKAILLVLGVLLLAVLCLYQAGGIEPLYERAHVAFGPGLGDFTNLKLSFFSQASLGAGLMLGMMGMPHLLIRFFTVPSAATARKSVVVATVLTGLVLCTLLFVVGPATLAFVKDVSAYEVGPGQMVGGTNMAFIHLAHAVGGELLYGIMSAVAFATILAVVAGLGVAIASTAAHDIYHTLVKDRGGDDERTELRVFRLSALAAAVVAVILALILQNENIAFLSALAFGVAASTNFPILLLALYWPKLTAFGAIMGGTCGLVLSVGLLILGPTVWQKILGHSEAIFPSDFSTLVAFPVAFAVAISASLYDRRRTPVSNPLSQEA